MSEGERQNRAARFVQQARMSDFACRPTSADRDFAARAWHEFLRLSEKLLSAPIMGHVAPKSPVVALHRAGYTVPRPDLSPCLTRESGESGAESGESGARQGIPFRQRPIAGPFSLPRKCPEGTSPRVSSGSLRANRSIRARPRSRPPPRLAMKNLLPLIQRGGGSCYLCCWQPRCRGRSAPTTSPKITLCSSVVTSRKEKPQKGPPLLIDKSENGCKNLKTIDIYSFMALLLVMIFDNFCYDF